MSDVPRHQLTPIELAIERAMRQDRINRRAFLGRAGRGGIALGAMLSLPALIAACSPSGSGDGVTIEWANWPAYIDIDEESAPRRRTRRSSPSSSRPGNNVNYQESILTTPTSSPRSSPTCRMATTPVGT